jgi:hypothetical protein
VRAVNLIPAEQRTGGSIGAGRSEGAAYAVLALVAGIAILAFLYGHAEHQISSRRAQVRTLSAEAQRAQALAGALAPYTNFISLREQRVKDVSELVGSRFDWAHAFHEFGRVLPANVSLSSLTGTIARSTSSSGSATAGSGSAASSSSASATPTSTSTSTSSSSSASVSSTPAAGGSSSAGASPVASATPPGSIPQIALTGCATSQPVVALMLERLRLMDGVSGVTLQSSTKSLSGGGGAGGSSCPAGNPAFTATVSFDPLPTAAATSAAVAEHTAAGAKGATR